MASLCIVIVDNASIAQFMLSSIRETAGETHADKERKSRSLSNFPSGDDKKPNKSTHRLSLNELAAATVLM